jgi:hypothetical protein
MVDFQSSFEDGKGWIYFMHHHREDYNIFTIRDEEEKKNIEKKLLEKSNSADSYILVNIADPRIAHDDSEFLRTEVTRLEDPAFNKVENWFTEALIADENSVWIQPLHQIRNYNHDEYDFCKECGQYKKHYMDEYRYGEGFHPYRCVCRYMTKIKTLQKFLKKRFLYKKLVSLIPAVTELYYSPGCKGEYLALRAFSEKLPKSSQIS